jgi:hypothetical protein
MSKKETRRAARQAFPKAKTPPPARSSYGNRPRSQRPGQNRVAARQTAKPASLKKAVIWGAVMAVIYFVLIQWGWSSGATAVGNAIIALISFVVFSAAVYGVDRWKYSRYLRKQKGSSK